MARLCGRPRRQAFEPRDLVPQELVLGPQRLVLSAQGLNGNRVRRIIRLRRHPERESQNRSAAQTAQPGNLPRLLNWGIWWGLRDNGLGVKCKPERPSPPLLTRYSATRP